MSEDPRNYSFNINLTKNSEFVDNINQVYIRTTEDKLINYIRDYRDCISRISRWQAPLSLAISFAATLLTATFTERYGQPASFWEALFVFLLIASVVWSLFAGGRAIFVARRATVGALIKRIKNNV